MDDDKGVLGCFNRKTGIVDTKIFKKENAKIETLKCWFNKRQFDWY